jgi:hypothetical protein
LGKCIGTELQPRSPATLGAPLSRIPVLEQEGQISSNVGELATAKMAGARIRVEQAQKRLPQSLVLRGPLDCVISTASECSLSGHFRVRRSAANVGRPPSPEFDNSSQCLAGKVRIRRGPWNDVQPDQPESEKTSDRLTLSKPEEPAVIGFGDRSRGRIPYPPAGGR